jgi:hypothetical protein
MQPVAYGAPVNPQVYSVPQQQQAMNRAAFQMPPTGQLQPGAMPSYLVNARGNLPRLGPTYQGGIPPAVSNAAQFAPRFSTGFVNGGHNPVPRQTPSGNTSESSNPAAGVYRPPPSQQSRRYGY